MCYNCVTYIIFIEECIESQGISNTHIPVGVNQYAILKDKNKALCTTNVKDCVVLVVYNIGKVTALAHIFPFSTIFNTIGDQNIARVLDDFLKAGGSLKHSSIMFIGGDTEKMIARYNFSCDIKDVKQEWIDSLNNRKNTEISIRNYIKHYNQTNGTDIEIKYETEYNEKIDFGKNLKLNRLPYSQIFDKNDTQSESFKRLVDKIEYYTREGGTVNKYEIEKRKQEVIDDLSEKDNLKEYAYNMYFDEDSKLHISMMYHDKDSHNRYLQIDGGKLPQERIIQLVHNSFDNGIRDGLLRLTDQPGAEEVRIFNLANECLKEAFGVYNPQYKNPMDKGRVDISEAEQQNMSNQQRERIKQLESALQIQRI